MKVALVYDRINKWGGAERVLLALHKLFPDAPIYTSVYHKESAKWAKEFEVKTSFLQIAPFLRKHNDLLAILMPVAFESFSFDEYDLVISVTSESAKGIITKPGTVHICYCLTPTRYLWSGYEEYFRSSFAKLISTPAVNYLKKWEMHGSARPDHYVAISTEVKNRIKKYYGRDAEILFPPVFIKKSKKRKKIDENYFLLVSRLSRFSYYKKVDLAVETFNKTNLILKIVGSGSLLGSMKKRAKGNIEFVGHISDDELGDYYENSRALIFPGLEDFGLVMAEAQSYGAPVIAYKAGGALDIVKEGKTGEFFKDQNPDSLMLALKKFNKSIYNKADIIENSERFSYNTFKSGIEKLLSGKIKI